MKSMFRRALDCTKFTLDVELSCTQTHWWSLGGPYCGGTEAAGQGDASATLLCPGVSVCAGLGFGDRPDGFAHDVKPAGPSPQLAKRNSAVTSVAVSVVDVFWMTATSSLFTVPLIWWPSVSVPLPAGRRPICAPMIASVTKRTPCPRLLPAGTCNAGMRPLP